MTELESVPAGTQIILRATVGSTIHGTAVAQQDDRDEMAIAVEPPHCVIGLQKWETSVYRTQPEGVRSGPGDLDLTVHSLRKFARLAAHGNPTILLPLFTPTTLEETPVGALLRAKRRMFLSKKCGAAFLGYLQAQRQRLTGERGQMRINRPELIEQYGYDTKYAGHVVRLALQGIELMREGQLTLPMPEHQRQTVVDIRTGKWTFDDVVQMATMLELLLQKSITKTSLPKAPDHHAINEFLVYAYERTWNEIRTRH